MGGPIIAQCYVDWYTLWEGLPDDRRTLVRALFRLRIMPQLWQATEILVNLKNEGIQKVGA
jgi:hypothetical protein